MPLAMKTVKEILKRLFLAPFLVITVLTLFATRRYTAKELSCRGMSPEQKKALFEKLERDRFVDDFISLAYPLSSLSWLIIVEFTYIIYVTF